ncbi:MAG: bifunctional 5,10-methylenetetrahydrofolate dehydrogenase/5,10-methenyltetrahydrofolate cyclohydrolase [bacterium]|nr:bifunctional 5,10-methylenetetrahydrofolate dehydrogenase/5,10-methenyltetrahydrofolate cyclohydrolase [bacterium]
MRIFNGKRKADEIVSELKKKIKKLKTKPALAVISVGSDPASKLFVRNKKRVAREIGIKVIHYKFKTKVKEKTLLEKIEKLNANGAVSSIIVQLPLPRRLNANKVINRINLKKDVDGFRKKSSFSSPLISSILIALKDSTSNLKKKKIITLVNSDIFGRTLEVSLKKEGIKTSYLKSKKSLRIKSVADVLITVLGRPGFIKGGMIKDRVVLIDAGITVMGKNKVVGDVNRKSVASKASFLTPVPGGIGPINVALLLKNVYLSCK